MPGLCQYHDCSAEWITGGSVSVPFVKVVPANSGKPRRVRRQYKRSNGVLAEPAEILKWRTKWTRACGVDEFPTKGFICKDHLPSTCFTDDDRLQGNLVFSEDNLPRPRMAATSPDKRTRPSRLDGSIGRLRTSLSPSSKKVLSAHEQEADKLFDQNVDLEDKVAALSERVELLEKESNVDKARLQVWEEHGSFIRYEKFDTKRGRDAFSTLVGVGSYELFGELYKLADVYTKGNAGKLHLYRAGRVRKAATKKGRDPKLNGINQMFATLFTLRTGARLNITSQLFGIHHTTMSRYFSTWVRVLAAVFQREMPFPSQEITRATCPPEWKEMFGHNRIRLVIDATNINVPSASDPDIQRVTWSSYYNCNVCKILIGTSPSGAITFPSLPFPGKIGDVDLTDVSVLALEILNEGDDVMGDKGFTVHHLLHPHGVGVVMPPKLQRNVAILTKDQENLTSAIANKRIHVERAMKRIKAFSYLNHTVPFDQLDLLGHVVFVIAMISNYQVPLKDTDLGVEVQDEGGPEDGKEQKEEREESEEEEEDNDDDRDDKEQNEEDEGEDDEDEGGKDEEESNGGEDRDDDEAMGRTGSEGSEKRPVRDEGEEKKQERAEDQDSERKEESERATEAAARASAARAVALELAMKLSCTSLSAAFSRVMPPPQPIDHMPPPHSAASPDSGPSQPPPPRPATPPHSGSSRPAPSPDSGPSQPSSPPAVVSDSGPSSSKPGPTSSTSRLPVLTSSRSRGGLDSRPKRATRASASKPPKKRHKGRSKQQETGSKQAAGSRQQEAGSTQQAARSSKRQADRQQASSIQQPTASSHGQTLFCVCDKPDDGTQMLGCECGQWFHQSCLQMQDSQWTQLTNERLGIKYYCQSCPKPDS